MAERSSRKRDRARIAAWSLTAVVAVLGTAGIVYQPDPEVDVICGSASFALDIGAVDYARAQVAIAASRDPEHAGVNLLQARIAMADGEYETAERHLDRVLAQEPGNEEAHLHYGWSAFQRGDFATALVHYEAGGPVLERVGRADILAEYRVRLGQLLLANGRAADAEVVGGKLIAEGTRPAVGHLISAFSRLAQGDDTGFGLALERAHSSDPLEPLFRQGPGPLARAFPWLPAP